VLPGATLLLALAVSLPPPAPSPAGGTDPGGIEPRLTIRESLDSYVVSAATEAQLRARLKLDEDPGNHGRALTEGRFVVTRSIVQREGRCEVEDVTIELDIHTTLPEWTPGERVPARLRDTWDRFLAFITAHEERHRRHLLDAAFAMRDRIAAMPPKARCTQLEAALKLIVDSEDRKRRFADRMVDRRGTPGPPE